MRTLFSLTLIVLLGGLLALPSARARSVRPLVIVHKDSKIDTISRRELRQIFLANTRVWPGGESIFLVVNTEDQDLLGSFVGLIRSDVVQFSKRWIKISLSGAAAPPTEAESDEETATLVSKHKGAIGFVSTPSERVKVVEISD